MSQALATTSKQDKLGTVRQMLEQLKPQVKLAMPAHLSADRAMRIAMNSIQKTPKLLECTRLSLAGAIMQSAQLGLDCDGVLGECYLIPYKGTAKLIPGYKGLLKLARQSGQISTIMVEVVYERDEFHYEFSSDRDYYKHIPSEEAEAGGVKYAYAKATMKDGGTQWVVMPIAKLEKIRKSSPGADSDSWKNYTEEMYKKTVLRRLCKLLPASTELARAVVLDERAEAGLEQEFESQPELEEMEKPVPASKLDAIVELSREPGSDDE